MHLIKNTQIEKKTMKSEVKKLSEDPSDGEGSGCELPHCCSCCEFLECLNHADYGLDDEEDC